MRNKSRAFSVAMLAAAVSPVGGEGDVGVCGIARDIFCFFYLKSQSGAALAPAADGVLIKAILLCG